MGNIRRASVQSVGSEIYFLDNNFWSQRRIACKVNKYQVSKHDHSPVTKINLHGVLFNICKLKYLKWTKRFGVLKIASCIINNSQFHMFDTKSYICYSEQMTQMQLCNCADFVRTVRNYCWQKLIWILYRQKYCEVWGRTTSINECSLLSKYLLWRKNIILFQLISPIFLEAYASFLCFDGCGAVCWEGVPNFGCDLNKNFRES